MTRGLQRVALAMSLTLALVAISAFDARAYDFENPYAFFSPEARAILETTDPDSCNESWQLYWGLLRDGEPAAGVPLFLHMLYGGLVPPGSSADRISLARHTRILLAYAVPSRDPLAVEFVLDSRETLGDEFVYCVASGEKTRQMCLDQAIAHGVLPSIEAYDREITALSEARKLPARCIDEAVLDPHTLGQSAYPMVAIPPPRPPCQNLWCRR